MKHLTILFLFMSLALTTKAQEVDIDAINFVDKFYLAVVNHKRNKVIKCMDKEYRKSQIKFLNGNKDQFVNELFSGTDLNTSEFVNPSFDEITTVEIVDVHKLNDHEWEYTFYVEGGKDGQDYFELTLLLKKTGKKYGFVGAVG